MGKLDFESFESPAEALKSVYNRNIIQKTDSLLKGNCHKNDKYDESIADNIIKTFNTWSFKREQPDSIQKITAAVLKAVKSQQPISFVLYWGKGPRCEQAHPDMKCLGYLNELAGRITQAYQPGAAITLIFTDTHAQLNGFSLKVTHKYFAEIAISAAQLDFDYCFLGDLTRTMGQPQLTHTPPSEEMLNKLTLSASKWYQGDNSPKLAASTYYAMNMVEKQAVEAAFPDAIFITFNGSEMRELFPDNMPIFYMYSLKRGTSVKPWFLPASDNVGPVVGLTASE